MTSDLGHLWCLMLKMDPPKKWLGPPPPKEEGLEFGIWKALKAIYIGQYH